MQNLFTSLDEVIISSWVFLPWVIIAKITRHATLLYCKRRRQCKWPRKTKQKKENKREVQ
jgi:hypothetical protein